MYECSKAIQRRLHDPSFARRYFVGNGIDIGGGNDALDQYSQLFPLMQSCRRWDIEDGDAQVMSGVGDNSYNFVHSSHCLEHMVDPKLALDNWLRILKFGGHLIVIVPDEDMYEQEVWPSTFNPDHKWTFTIYKERSWSPVSINILDLLHRRSIVIQSIKLLNATHRVTKERFDQTLTPVGESAIEFVVRKC